MSSVERAKATQIENIQKKTGKSMQELTELIESSGLTKHGEIRSMLMEKLGLGYGDATMLIQFALKTDVQMIVQEKGLTTDDVLDEIYAGPKASLRPIHEKLMSSINQFGEFEIAPKKGYVSLRRKRQFAMLGPATNTRFELGINIKDLETDERLFEQPAGSMCNYKVRLTDPEQVDDTIVSWVRRAYEAAV
jgi:t-SNARE complex subunit (syntaxin)